MQSWKNWHDQAENPNPGHEGWFPMQELTFVGLISLNDPPRKGVN